MKKLLTLLMFIPIIGMSQNEKKPTFYKKKTTEMQKSYLRYEKKEEKGRFKVEETKDSSGVKSVNADGKNYKRSKRVTIKKSPTSTVIIDFIKNEGKKTTTFSNPE